MKSRLAEQSARAIDIHDAKPEFYKGGRVVARLIFAEPVTVQADQELEIIDGKPVVKEKT